MVRRNWEQLTCQARVGRKRTFLYFCVHYIEEEDEAAAEKKYSIFTSSNQFIILFSYQPKKLTLNKIVKRASHLFYIVYGILCRALSPF